MCPALICRPAAKAAPGCSARPAQCPPCPARRAWRASKEKGFRTCATGRTTRPRQPGEWASGGGAGEWSRRNRGGLGSGLTSALARLHAARRPWRPMALPALVPARPPSAPVSAPFPASVSASAFAWPCGPACLLPALGYLVWSKTWPLPPPLSPFLVREIPRRAPRTATAIRAGWPLEVRELACPALGGLTDEVQFVMKITLT